MPAESLAQFGTIVSRALAEDLSASGSALLSDSTALAAFLGPTHQMLTAGEKFQQPALASFLANVQRADAAVSSGRPPRWILARADRVRDQDIFALPARKGDTAMNAAGFAVVDAAGNAVSCALTLGRTFGNGRIADGVLSASPDLAAAPLAASIAVDHASHDVRSGAAGLEKESRWVCPGGLSEPEKTCEVAAATERGGYALMVVRGAKM